jgi:hypothetical protein
VNLFASLLIWCISSRIHKGSEFFVSVSKQRRESHGKVPGLSLCWPLSQAVHRAYMCLPRFPLSSHRTLFSPCRRTCIHVLQTVRGAQLLPARFQLPTSVQLHVRSHGVRTQLYSAKRGPGHPDRITVLSVLSTCTLHTLYFFFRCSKCTRTVSANDGCDSPVSALGSGIVLYRRCVCLCRRLGTTSGGSPGTILIFREGKCRVGFSALKLLELGLRRYGMFTIEDKVPAITDLAIPATLGELSPAVSIELHTHTSR